MDPTFQRLLRANWATLTLIALCVVMYVLDALSETISAKTMGMVPAHLFEAWESVISQSWNSVQWLEFTTLFSYIFMHANMEHIFFNMLYVWVFGYLVGEILGQRSVLAIFLLTGLAGGLVHGLLNQNDLTPMVGASGALMGLEGVYFGMVIRWRLPLAYVWPIARPIPPENLFIFALIGVAFDFFALSGGAITNIAHGAHIGGFVLGAFLGSFIIRRPHTIEQR